MPALSATIITHTESANIARVIRHAFEGFAAQKNFSSEQAQYDWILSLDADEELDAKAQAAIVEWKRSELSAAGYQFARRAHYLGRWILHSGWYPDYKLRLFDRSRGSRSEEHTSELQS